MNAASALSRAAKREETKQRLNGTPLTWREDTVLRGVALGMTNAEIGARLYVSEQTVKTHLRVMFAKLGASNRVELVLIGIEQGLLPCPCVRRSPKVAHPEVTPDV